MNRRKMRRQIHHAYSHLTPPDVLHSVVSDCQEQKGQVVNMPSQTKTAKWVKRAVCAAAVFLLLAGGALLGIQYHNINQSVASTISLDVNPSIEIKVNQKEKVLEVTAKNEDARTIIGNMDFHGSTLDVTVNALIGSMLQKGYLSEMANSILVSVDSNDPDQSETLKRELTQKINQFFQTGSFSGSVLSQTITANAQLKQLAGQYGITLGKAQLIQQILEQDSRHTFESLAPLTIHELNLLRSSTGRPESNAIKSVGSASDKAYIGQAQAKSAALAHAGVAESAVGRFSIEFDYEDGVMLYEVEFDACGYEYSYDINAQSGDVVGYEKERDGNEPANGPDNNASSGSSPYIGETKAKSIAFGHAGISASQAQKVECELELDDGHAEYEVEFDSAGYEYSYKIDAQTGAVTKQKRERDD